LLKKGKGKPAQKRGGKRGGKESEREWKKKPAPSEERRRYPERKKQTSNRENPGVLHRQNPKGSQAPNPKIQAGGRGN